MQPYLKDETANQLEFAYAISKDSMDVKLHFVSPRYI